MSKFIVASRQAMETDKTRILLETRIQEVRNDCKGWAEVAAKAKDEAKELQNLVKELRVDIVKKDTHLDHLQKRNDKLSTLLNKAKEDAIVEFRASKQFTNLLDTNYVAGFEDFRMDVMENLLDTNTPNCIHQSLASSNASQQHQNLTKHSERVW